LVTQCTQDLFELLYLWIGFTTRTRTVVQVNLERNRSYFDRRDLAPWLVLAGVFPLGFVLRRRNF